MDARISERDVIRIVLNPRNRARTIRNAAEDIPDFFNLLPAFMNRLKLIKVPKSHVRNAKVLAAATF